MTIEIGSLNTRGPQGEPGKNGADGSEWLTGVGKPSDELGRDSDLYLDTRTANIYQRVLGVWVYQTNIQGKKGDKGDKGDKGERGLTGFSVSQPGGSSGGSTEDGSSTDPYTALNVKTIPEDVYHKIKENYENVVTRIQYVTGVLICDGVNTIL